jgi:hypothetical protein
MPTAPVVVDVQQGIFTCDPPPYHAAEVLERIATLLERGRAALLSGLMKSPTPWRIAAVRLRGVALLVSVAALCSSVSRGKCPARPA